MADLTDDAARCATCGYTLIGLSEPRCPECGAAFEPRYLTDAPQRARLLPWERAAEGRAPRRLLRTLLQAWWRPRRYFANAAQRKDQALDGPARLLLSSVLAALVLQAIGIAGDRALFVWHLRVRGTPWRRITQATWSLIRTLGSTEITLNLVQLVAGLLAVSIVAALLKRLLRIRTGVLTDVDLTALLSPAIPLEALLWTVLKIMIACDVASIQALPTVLLVVMAIVPVFAWFCCRYLLLLNITKSIGVIVLCTIIAVLIRMATESALIPLNLLVLQW